MLLVHGLACYRNRAQKVFRVRTQCSSRGRQRDVRPAANKEFCSQRFLEQVYASTHCGLAQAQSLCRAMETSIGRDRQERLNLIDVHKSSRWLATILDRKYLSC